MRSICSMAIIRANTKFAAILVTQSRMEHALWTTRFKVVSCASVPAVGCKHCAAMKQIILLFIFMDSHGSHGSHLWLAANSEEWSLLWISWITTALCLSNPVPKAALRNSMTHLDVAGRKKATCQHSKWPPQTSVVQWGAGGICAVLFPMYCIQTNCIGQIDVITILHNLSYHHSCLVYQCLCCLPGDWNENNHSRCSTTSYTFSGNAR